MLIQLPDRFHGRGSQNGWLFTKLIESDNAAVYRKIDEYGNIYYETFLKREVPVYDFKNKSTTEDTMIAYPSDSVFGLSSWCFSDYYKCIDKYVEIGGTIEKTKI